MNLKRIAIAGGTIIGTLAVVVGITGAIFTDTDTFTGNTISTATVDIDARSEPMRRLPKPLVASGLIPGQYTDWARGIVFNTAASTNVRLYMHVDNVTGAACPVTNLQVYTGHAASGADSERGWLLFNNNINNLSGSASRIEITGYVFNPTIPPNNSAVIQQRAQLDSSADNAYQNTSCTWDEVFVAETPIP